MKNWKSNVALATTIGLGAVVLSSINTESALAQGNGATSLNCDNTPCDAVARGRAAFNDHNLKNIDGNGRACSDCHVPSDSFQLSPSIARARYEALIAKRVYNKNADDPLFRPVDADDYRVNGDNATDFSNLVDNGLVRVTMPLPLNVKVIDPATGQPSADTSVDLWRAVIPVLNVAMTGPDNVLPIWPPVAQKRVPILGQDPNGPNRQGGYQHDARYGTLQEQARGALFAHAQVTQEPSTNLLDDLAAFQATLFSSPGAELLSAEILSGSAVTDPDPELNPLEQDGKLVFNRVCSICHGSPLHPSMTTSDASIVRPVPRYHNILTACPRPATDGFSPCPDRINRNARTYQVTLANGAVQTVTTSDPGRMLLTGQIADLGQMDVTQLRGISKTAPYFHNNSAATLEEVVDHYDAFFRRLARVFAPPNLPPVISSNGTALDRARPVTPEEREALLAYLRKL